MPGGEGHSDRWDQQRRRSKVERAEGTKVGAGEREFERVSERLGRRSGRQTERAIEQRRQRKDP